MEEKTRNIKTASGLNILTAIWLILSPFLIGYGVMAARTNDIIVGIVLGILASLRFITASTSTTWLSWINAALGVWLIFSPFIIGYTTSAQIWNSVIVGILAVAFSAWSINGSRILEESKRERESTAST